MIDFEIYDNAANTAEQLCRAADMLRTTYEAMKYGPNAKTGYESSIWFLAEIISGYAETLEEFMELVGAERRAAAAKKQA
jgi:hypothetical protein